jgi:hypothetical protein
MTLVIDNFDLAIVLVLDVEHQSQALERGALFNHLNNLSSLLEAMIADSDVLDARTTSRTHALEEALQCRKITALEVVEAVERHACETAELLVADKQRAEKICKRTQIRPGGVLDPAVWCGGDRIGEHGGLLEGLKTQSKVRVSEENGKLSDSDDALPG